MTIKYDGFVGKKFPSLHHLEDALKKFKKDLMSSDYFDVADVTQRIIDGIRENPDQYEHCYDSEERSFRLPNFVGLTSFIDSWKTFCDEHADEIITVRTDDKTSDPGFSTTQEKPRVTWEVIFITRCPEKVIDFLSKHYSWEQMIPIKKIVNERRSGEWVFPVKIDIVGFEKYFNDQLGNKAIRLYEHKDLGSAGEQDFVSFS